MDIEEFVTNVSNENTYEKTIFNWINSLYDNNIGIKKAILIIHKKRMDAIFNTKLDFNIQHRIDETFLKTMKILERNSKFRELNESEVAQIKERVHRLAASNLYHFSSIVEQMLFIFEIKQANSGINITNWKAI